MSDIYTPEFIKLASKIQAMIEPEKEMMVFYKVPKEKSRSWGFIVELDKKGKPLLFRVRFYRGSCLETTHWFDKDDIYLILIPSLSWLVRKLRESGYPTLESERDESPWWCAVFGDDGFAEAIECGFADTPELACLKALCKIKGIEVTE